PPHASLTLADSSLHDFVGVAARGTLTLERVELTRCSGSCIEVSHPQASATVRHSAFTDGAATGVLLSSCPLGIGVDIASSTFAGMDTGIANSCRGPMVIRHNTFDSNQTGVSYLGGTGQVLQDNVFTSNAASAVSCGTAGFTTRDDNLLHQNASNGCAGADPGVLLSDPLFVYPVGGDLRLQSSSPAVDSAFDLGLDTNGPGPGNFFGAGPDRGGVESH
ncbi:MAG: right-handed parallel beta-helix repeat-containing protein, partial [Myxococcaceae bacterium]